MIPEHKQRLRDIQDAVDNFVEDTGIPLVVISRYDSPNVHCYLNDKNHVTRICIDRKESVTITLHDPKMGTVRE